MKSVISYGSIILLMIVGLSLGRMETVFSQNGLNLRLNRFAAAQSGHCYSSSTPPIAHISADQFNGIGALKHVDVDSDDQRPERYFKIYGNNAISVTVSLSPGQYQLELFGKHAQPGPVILKVMANQLPVGTLNYARDDGSWELQCLMLSSFHWNGKGDDLTVAVRFTNDGGPQGARDASIAWLRLR